MEAFQTAGELWDFSLCRPFTCTKPYNTLQGRENYKKHNKASLTDFLFNVLPLPPSIAVHSLASCW